MIGDLKIMKDKLFDFKCGPNKPNLAHTHI